MTSPPRSPPPLAAPPWTPPAPRPGSTGPSRRSPSCRPSGLPSGAGPVPATVPGEVYGDLLAAGLIPDPFDGDNEHRLHWIGSTDWSYRTSFTFEPGTEQRHDLVFAGLDTLATVLLNGTEVGRTANMHRSHRFDVTGVLVAGENHLEVRFEGPVTGADRLSAELGERPRAYDHPFNAIRKMAAGYGWDWGPDLAGVGIWKSVGIESWSGVRLGTVRPLALVDGASGRLETHVELEWAADAEPVQVAVTVAGQTVTATAEPGQSEVVLELTVPDVELWWPLGYGPQTRYDVTVEVAGQTHPRRCRLPHRRAVDLARRARERLRDQGQRVPDLRQGLQLDPRRRVAHQADARHVPEPRSPRPSTAVPTCCGSGVAASTRATPSTTSATSSASWSGRTSCSPAPRTRKRSRCAAR